MKKKTALFTFRLVPILLVVTGCSLINIDEYKMESVDTMEGIYGERGETDVYYYYFDEKISLNERRDLLCIQFYESSSRERFVSGLTSISSLKIWDPYGKESYDWKNSFDILVLQSRNGLLPMSLLTEVATLSEVKSASYLYEYQGNEIAVLDEFSVRLNNISDYDKMVGFAEQYNCSIYRREWFDENTFFVCKSKESEYGTIALADLFYETGWFGFTSPSFFSFKSICSVDSYYSDQWGLKNTGQNGGLGTGVDINIESAWNITEGSSDIVVAIVDDGVDLAHPDLSANLMTGYDAIYDSVGGGHEGDDRHGTAVAGIVGAIKDNGIGIRGVAPECKIIPVRVMSNDIVSYPAATAAFNWARLHNVDVINCSWKKNAPCALLTSAISDATSLGRGGKGCVVAFSSGNDAANSVCYPAYLDNVLAVGSISYLNQRSYFSNYGTSLDVVAPGEFISTTDRLGNDGFNPPKPGWGDPSFTDYNDTNYTNWFRGTSAAAPFVSGIAALILSEYPDLTATQIRRAIELGCTYISGYVFHEDDNYPAGLWNNEVGYGRVNAYNALLWAEFAHETNVTDGISGFDFTLTNNSSYDVWALFVGLSGDISNYNEMLIFHDPGDVDSGKQVGYPFYRGENLSATPGTPVSNIWLELFAMTPNYYGDLRIGVAIDNPTPTTYTTVSFGDGDTVFLNLPNSTVPNASRRRVYIDVKDPLL